MQPVEPPIKRKNQSPLRIIVNQWGCLLAFVMLGLGAAIGLLGAIFIGPQLLGFDVTATALMDRDLALAATEVELDVQAQDAIARSTAFALDVQSTQAVLNNDADLLAQTATQSSQNIIATATAIAVSNIQRQTQIANDYVSTQAALDANATQVELDFRNTQAALPNANNADAAAQSNTVAIPAQRYRFDFAQLPTLDALSGWQLSRTSAWSIAPDGLLAVENTAQLRESAPRILQENNVTGDYTITFEISPSVTMTADYWLTFGLTEEQGLALHLTTQTLRIVEVGIYRFDQTQWEAGLNRANLTVIQRNAADVPLSSQTQLAITDDGQGITLSVNETVILEASTLSVPRGVIGVQLPPDTTLRTISVDDR